MVLTQNAHLAKLPVMLDGLNRWAYQAVGLLLIALLLGAGCAYAPPLASRTQVHALQTALVQLGPEVAEVEAARVADVAYDYPRELAAQYRLVRPPLWHNFLINLGLKKRGLCYQWAEDLEAKLQAMKLQTLELHWGVAHPGSFREHNTVVLTAPRQPFDSGIVLDPWRHSGVLYWGVVTDDTYPWREGLLTPAPASTAGANISESGH